MWSGGTPSPTPKRVTASASPPLMMNTSRLKRCNIWITIPASGTFVSPYTWAICRTCSRVG